MTKEFTDTRRDLRERAFQALFAMETGTELLAAGQFAYDYDKEASEEDRQVPIFLLNLIKGVKDHQEELDQLITAKLKAGWSLERLTQTDRTLLRLGLYEMTLHEETPDLVALNEIIEIAKKYSDETSSKFVNGLLRQFLTEN